MQGLLTRGLVAQIARGRDTAPTFCFHQTLCLFSVSVLVEVGQCHISTLAREEHTDGPSDPAVATGDQDDLSASLALP
jgi:hypothetical protein